MSQKLNVAAMFEGFEAIETERLILRIVHESDAEAMFDILSDPEVIRYFGSPPMATVEQAAAGANASLKASMNAPTFASVSS